MRDMTRRRERYSDGFALTKYTLPVVWQMSSVIPGGFFIYHEDDRREIIYVNKKVLEIYGCETLDEFRELTGYTFEGMVHPEDFARIQDSIDVQIDDEGGDSMDHVEYRIIRKDGSVRWVDDYGHFSYSPEYGDVYFVFISDITEKKAMMRSAAELKKLYADMENVLEDISRLKLKTDRKMEEDLAELKREMKKINP